MNEHYPYVPAPKQAHPVRTVVLVVLASIVGIAATVTLVVAATSPNTGVIPSSVVTRTPGTTVPSTPAPSTPATVPAQPTAEPALQPIAGADDAFLTVVHNAYPKTSLLADDTLISLAKSSCAALGEGGDWPTVLTILKQSADTQEDAMLFAYIAGAGVGAYCPQYSDRVHAVAGGLN